MMTEKEIIGKLYVENQKQAEIIKSLKETKIEGKLSERLREIRMYVINHTDMVPESYYNDIMRILERAINI